MLILYAMLIGFALDLLFGDPAWLPHPVVWMGRYISGYERRVRPLFPKTPRGELWCGALLAVSLPLLSFALARGVCLLARRLHPAAELAVQSFWCAQALAARGLACESKNVYEALRGGDLPGARKAVARTRASSGGIRSASTPRASPKRRWRPWRRTSATAWSRRCCI